MKTHTLSQPPDRATGTRRLDPITVSPFIKKITLWVLVLGWGSLTLAGAAHTDSSLLSGSAISPDYPPVPVATVNQPIPAEFKTGEGSAGRETLHAVMNGYLPAPIAEFYSRSPARGTSYQSGRIWTVEAGDSLWKIAQKQAGPHAKDIEMFWQRLLQHNRGRFRSGRADVLIVGEQILLPES